MLQIWCSQHYDVMLCSVLMTGWVYDQKELFHFEHRLNIFRQLFDLAWGFVNVV